MQISLFNSKNPNGKRVPVTVVIEHSDKKSTNDGELVYLVSLHTGVNSVSGTRIDPVYIDFVTKDTFQEEIKTALSLIGNQIDWGILENDNKAPLVRELLPKDKEENVSINRDVFITLKDPFPASLIDIDTLSFRVNGSEVIGQAEVTEKSNEVFLHWQPYRILD